MAAYNIKLVSLMNQSISMERNTSYLLWITQRLQKNAFCQAKIARSAHPTFFSQFR